MDTPIPRRVYRTLDDAMAAWKATAKAFSFNPLTSNTDKDSKDVIYQRRLACNLGGKKDGRNKKEGVPDEKRRKRTSRKLGCEFKAMIKLDRSTGQWILESMNGRLQCDSIYSYWLLWQTVTIMALWKPWHPRLASCQPRLRQECRGTTLIGKIWSTIYTSCVNCRSWLSKYTTGTTKPQLPSPRTIPPYASLNPRLPNGRHVEPQNHCRTYAFWNEELDIFHRR